MSSQNKYFTYRYIISFYQIIFKNYYIISDRPIYFVMHNIVHQEYMVCKPFLVDTLHGLLAIFKILNIQTAEYCRYYYLKIYHLHYNK